MVAHRTDDDHDVLSRIVCSDAAQILHIFPACDTLRFRSIFDTSSSERVLSLKVGECGDSEVWVSSTGSVCKIVVRESVLRKVGQNFEVRKPLGQYFKAIAPFQWAPTLRDGVCAPMISSTNAIILMYMHIWARKNQEDRLKLPPLTYDDLYDALVTLCRAMETDRMLPERHRLVPQDTYEKLIEAEREDERSNALESPHAPPTPDTPNMPGLQHDAFGKKSRWDKHDTPVSETTDSELEMNMNISERRKESLPVTVTPELRVAPGRTQPQQSTWKGQAQFAPAEVYSSNRAYRHKQHTPVSETADSDDEMRMDILERREQEPRINVAPEPGIAQRLTQPRQSRWDTPPLGPPGTLQSSSRAYREKQDTPVPETSGAEESMHVEISSGRQQALPITVTSERGATQRSYNRQQPTLESLNPVPAAPAQVPSPSHVPSDISPEHLASAQALMLRLYGTTYHGLQIPRQ